MLKFNKNKINHRKEKFGGLIINIETGKIFKLNKTGYKIFLALYNSVKIEKLIQNLQKEYKISKNKIEIDIKYFINELINGGFLLKS